MTLHAVTGRTMPCTYGFRQIAIELNDAGYWVRHPFSDNFEIPFTEVLVKEMLYKPTAKAMFNKETTT